jgi:uncharacterized protein DUF1801
MNDAVAAYAAALDPQRAAICANLQSSINELLPQATSRLWHGIPVWFIGENPVVGYTTRKQGVMLMFWNGQHFAEPELESSGSFHMAQIAYNDESEINRDKLAIWLSKAGTSIWDMVGERNAFVAERRALKAKAKTKPKAKAKPKVKAKAKAKPKAKAKVSAKSKPSRKKAAKKKSRPARKK